MFCNTPLIPNLTLLSNNHSKKCRPSGPGSLRPKGEPPKDNKSRRDGRHFVPQACPGRSAVPSGLDRFQSIPGVKTPGYSQMSLRDKRHRPKLAGTGSQIFVTLGEDAGTPVPGAYDPMGNRLCLIPKHSSWPPSPWPALHPTLRCLCPRRARCPAARRLCRRRWVRWPE